MKNIVRLRREIITRNSVRCLKCKMEIISRSVHDMRSCVCGNIAVDGGNEYRRRVGDLDGYEDTSIFTEEEYDYDFSLPTIEERIKQLK